MADKTSIEWTATVNPDGSVTPGSTWNPTVGCSVITSGCTNCYAMKMAGRLEAMGSPIYKGHTIKTRSGFVWNGKVGASNWGQVIKPLSWKQPRRIFVNSMSDLFHEDMPVGVIDQVFAVMALCPQHTFQILTKRHVIMRDYLLDRGTPARVNAAMNEIAPPAWCKRELDDYGGLPLPNVWLGVSVEDQNVANYRVPALLETPAAIRFLSCEPLLGPVDLTRIGSGGVEFNSLDDGSDDGVRPEPTIDWLIVGGESGPGRRPMDLAWMRSLRDQCVAANVSFFVKQIDKVQPIPDDLRVRQFPTVAATTQSGVKHCHIETPNAGG